MAKLSAEAKKQIMSWIDKLEDGDSSVKYRKIF